VSTQSACLLGCLGCNYTPFESSVKELLIDVNSFGFIFCFVTLLTIKVWWLVCALIFKGAFDLLEYLPSANFPMSTIYLSKSLLRAFQWAGCTVCEYSFETSKLT